MPMKQMTVEAKSTNPDRTIQFEIPIGETLADNVVHFGEEVVNTQFTQKYVIAAQGLARNQLKAGKPEAEIVAAMKAWKLGVASPRGPVDPVGAILRKVAAGDMPKEVIEDLLKKLTAAQKQK